MKTYKIPILWESIQTFEVEAENLEDAVKAAVKEFLAIPDEHYLEDSFSIDNMIDDDYPDESYGINKILNEV